MVKQKTMFPEIGNYQIHIRKRASDSGVWISSCETLDIAISVALNFHQLSNCVHYITVLDDSGNELVHFSRLDTVRLNLQNNAR